MYKQEGFWEFWVIVFNFLLHLMTLNVYQMDFLSFPLFIILHEQEDFVVISLATFDGFSVNYA